MRILLVVAGTNEPSNSATLASAMAQGIADAHPDAIIDTVRLNDVEIGHFNLACYGPSCPIDGMTAVEALLMKADGVVLASPVWNFGVPAHLKNFIDRMGSFALDASHSIGTLNGKPFFLIYTAGAPRAAWPLFRRTLSSIPAAIQYFGGSILGTFFEGSCTLGRGVFGLVVDKRPARLESAKEAGRRFAKHVDTFMKTGRLPLRYRVIKKCVRVMQKMKRKIGM